MVEVALAKCGGDHTYQVTQRFEGRWHDNAAAAEQEALNHLAGNALVQGDCEKGTCEGGLTCLVTFDVGEAQAIIKTKAQFYGGSRLRYKSSVEQGANFNFTCECGEDVQ